MFDSTAAHDIPRNAALVAGYVNGRYAWSQADWNLFQPQSRVAISVNAWYFEAIVLDVEAGDATPAEANGFIVGAGPASGFVPTLYGTRRTLDICQRLVAIAGLECDYWLADWTTIPHLPPGYSCCQYAAPGHGSPGHFDMSVVADWWPRKLVPTPLDQLRTPPSSER
jgi:hypothetical protein